MRLWFVFRPVFVDPEGRRVPLDLFAEVGVNPHTFGPPVTADRLAMSAVAQARRRLGTQNLILHAWGYGERHP